MTEASISNARIRAGRWEGVLEGAGDQAPDIRVTHLGQAIDGVAVVPEAPGWRISVPIPVEVLSDGVQSFVVQDGAGARLASFTIVTGVPLEDDLRAEIDLLRAELDLLKAAFRRHCAQTDG